MTSKSTVTIDGHVVDARRVDEFYNGSDGTRVSDAQWDESKLRAGATPDSIDLSELGFEYVGSECPAGDEIAVVDHG